LEQSREQYLLFERTVALTPSTPFSHLNQEHNDSSPLTALAGFIELLFPALEEFTIEGEDTTLEFPGLLDGRTLEHPEKKHFSILAGNFTDGKCLGQTHSLSLFQYGSDIHTPINHLHSGSLPDQ